MRFSLVLIITFISIKLYSQISAPNIYPGVNFHKDSLYVVLSSEQMKPIYYTLEGSEPTLLAERYKQPILIKKTSVVKARCFSDDSTFSPVSTSTFFVNEKTTLPVVSLSTDPANLFDSKIGIYVASDQVYMERPAHIEFFELNRTRGFNMDIGIKIHGEGSATFPQKSLGVYARKVYGEGKINYKLFPHLNIDEFEGFILRNGGSDWNKSMLRDGLLHTLVNDLNVEKQAYRPAVLFINGEYWGIHNIREKADEHFLAAHHNLDPDSIDLIKYWFAVQGDTRDYDELKNFIKQKDLFLQSNYDYVKTRIDMDAYLNYIITETYFDNTDWPGNNIKFWRPQRDGAKWRWILYDLDCGLDMKERQSHKHPSLSIASSRFGVDYELPPWSNEILVGLLKSPQFRNELANRFADLASSLFRADNVLKLLNQLKFRIEPEITRHFARWDSSVANWYNHIGLIELFVKERLPYIQQDYINKLMLTGITKINLDVNNIAGGRIKINSIMPEEYPWTGEYFNGIPVMVSAMPFPGYKFITWKELNAGPSITFTPDEQPVTFTALFEPDVNYSPIVINEINYNSSAEFDTEDWIELHNPGSADIDISGWRFKDSNDNNVFSFPQSTTLKAGEYLVLCRDTSSFRSFYPGLKNIIGSFGFGLSNAGDLIRLYNNEEIIVDSLTYDDNPPWDPEADGSGNTLELKDPLLENSNAANWTALIKYGTPGRNNSQYTYLIDSGNQLVHRYLLHDCYPNPFNPTTIIGYDLPENSNVLIKIYDVLGNETAVLVNEQKAAGFHKITFNAKYLPSGIYFYRMQARDYTLSKKMLLVK